MSETETEQVGDLAKKDIPVADVTTAETVAQPSIVQPQEPVKKDRMVAARAALAKKRAEKALVRLEKEKKELNRRLGLEEDEKIKWKTNPMEKPTSEENIVVVDDNKNEAIPETKQTAQKPEQDIFIEEKPKEESTEKRKEEEEKKMSSSDDIVVEPIKMPEMLQLSPMKRKRKDKKKKKKQPTPKKPEKKKSSSESEKEDDERSLEERPRKKPKTKPTEKTQPPIEDETNDPGGEGFFNWGRDKALQHWRNINIPPMVVDATKSTISSVGWGSLLFVLLLAKRALQVRVERYVAASPLVHGNPNIGIPISIVNPNNNMPIQHPPSQERTERQSYPMSNDPRLTGGPSTRQSNQPNVSGFSFQR